MRVAGAGGGGSLVPVEPSTLGKLTIALSLLGLLGYQFLADRTGLEATLTGTLAFAATMGLGVAMIAWCRVTDSFEETLPYR